jgi:hypothetical protein
VGVADGSANNIINSRSATESEKTYLGQVTLTAPESMGSLKGATLSIVVMDHASTGGPGSSPNIVNYYVGGTVPTPLEGLSLGAAYDYRGNSRGPATSAAHAQAVSIYTLYKPSPKFSFNTRAEYTAGSDGTFYTAGPGRGNDLFGLTLTAGYSFWDNVVSRLEFRWDHELHGLGVFNDGSDKNAFALALNLIYQF